MPPSVPWNKKRSMIGDLASTVSAGAGAVSGGITKAIQNAALGASGSKAAPVAPPAPPSKSISERLDDARESARTAVINKGKEAVRKRMSSGGSMSK